MKSGNRHIAHILARAATLMEIAGENKFKVGAFKRAVRNVAACEVAIHQFLAANGRLPDLPGIGASLDEKIRAIIATGGFPELTQLESRIAPSVLELVRIRGLGTRKAGTLMRVGIDTIEALQSAVDDGTLAQLPGLGDRSVDRIQRSLNEYLSHRGRWLRHVATHLADSATGHLLATGLCEQVHTVGSTRRGQESAGDVDIVAVTRKPEAVLDSLISWDETVVLQPPVQGRAGVETLDGPIVDIRTVRPGGIGSVLALMTASAAHLEQLLSLRPRARIEEGVVHDSQGPVLVDTEVEFYARFGLPFIPPELREGSGELEAALAGRLPDLVDQSHIRGDLHMHTPHSDGKNSMEELATVAGQLGYEYMAFADHTQNVAIANGMTQARTLAYLEAVEELAGTLSGITLLTGIEVDILEDGSLDLPDDILARMDVVIASIHSHFNLPEDKMTQRLLRAMDSRFVNIMGHPTCRLIGSRSPIPLDMERVIEGAAQTGTMLELNSNPERLDLNAPHCRMARDAGVQVVISTDAHRTEQLSNMKFGVTQARRGWLEPHDVANTRPLREFLKLLQKKR